MNTSLTETQQAERLQAILGGTAAPNPVLSLTFRNQAGEPDVAEIPARFQEAFALLFLNFMTKEMLEGERGLAELLAETRKAHAEVEALHTANQQAQGRE